MRNTSPLTLVLCAALAASVSPCVGADLQVSRLYSLSDFNGPVPYSDVRIFVDRSRDEVYVAASNLIRIFNGSGMEIFRIDAGSDLGLVADIAADETGDILLLTHDLTPSPSGPRWTVSRCDYRGTLIERIAFTDLPAAFDGFSPNRMLYRDGQIVLVSMSQLKVAIGDTSGRFLRGHDLARLLAIDEPANNQIFGFDLDHAGTMLFTIPVVGKVFVVTPDESVRAFGRSGSNPGSFGIVSGIVADDLGHYVVADMRRGVVMVFDESFEFVTEFGNETERHELVRPTDLRLGNSGKIYVTQAGNKGVSVFGLTGVAAEHSPDTEPSMRGGDVDSERKIGALKEPATESARVPARLTQHSSPMSRTLRAGVEPRDSHESDVAELPESKLEE